MVRYPEYSNPGLYLSDKHSPPPWSRCPGSNTVPCPCCGNPWLSPPLEVKGNTPGYCLDATCNCCSKHPDGIFNKDLSSCQHHGEREQCKPCLNPAENGQPISPSKSTQCYVENPNGFPERDGKAYCHVSCIQPFHQSEVSLPYCGNQTCAICVSNMANPPGHCINTCCNFCPPHDQYIPCPCVGFNYPFYRRPFYIFPPCASQHVPEYNGVTQSPTTEKRVTCDKSVLCKPADLMILVGGKFQDRARNMRNGLQDHL